MTKDFLYNKISEQRFAVLATVSDQNEPQSALVGFAITADLKIIFDTVSSSRKYFNLLKNSAISFVIGSGNEQTIQYEGIAKMPAEAELEDLLPCYFKAFPD